jgi:excisionase family DNA binding protein
LAPVGDEDTMTVDKFAAEMGVSKETARRWVRQGLVRAWRPTTIRGPWRIYADEVARLKGQGAT